MTTTRLPGNDHRTRDVVHHLAAMLEHLGRTLTALEQGNWDSARDHLSRISEQAAITNVCLNGGHPDAAQALAAAREQLPAQWATPIAAFLDGGRRD